MTKLSHLEIAGIAIGAVIVLGVSLYGGTKTVSRKLGVEPETIYSVWKNPKYDTTEREYNSDDDDDDDDARPSSGGSRRRNKKRNKRKTKVKRSK